jgi:hypothetical protein
MITLNAENAPAGSGTGKVYVVGVGPGARDLISVRVSAHGSGRSVRLATRADTSAHCARISYPDSFSG